MAILHGLVCLVAIELSLEEVSESLVSLLGWKDSAQAHSGPEQCSDTIGGQGLP